MKLIRGMTEIYDITINTVRDS